MLAYVCDLKNASQSSVAMWSQIGFIGLGNMGAKMAGRLMDAGHQLLVHDINQDVLKAAAALGAEIADSPSTLAATRGLRVIVTMLPSSDHVLDAYCREVRVLLCVCTWHHDTYIDTT